MGMRGTDFLQSPHRDTSTHGPDLLVCLESDVQLLSQCGSVSNCLSRSVPEIHCSGLLKLDILYCAVSCKSQS